MRKIIFIYISFISITQVYSKIIEDTFYINRGKVIMTDSSQLINILLNNDSIFSSYPSVLDYNLNDSVRLTIINNDTIQHNFSIEKFMIDITLNSNDTNSFLSVFNNAGSYSYKSKMREDSYLGLYGIVNIRESSTINLSHYFWNIREQDSVFNKTILKGNIVTWNSYNPIYFILNGNGKEKIALDPTAMVKGTVGEEIIIVIANTGEGLHSIHFHGYHTKILFSNKNPEHENRIKDTFPLEKGEYITLSLIPDKKGMYPVHDHNLIAVTGGGYYPNGIFLMLDIQ